MGGGFQWYLPTYVNANIYLHNALRETVLTFPRSSVHLGQDNELNTTEDLLSSQLNLFLSGRELEWCLNGLTSYCTFLSHKTPVTSSFSREENVNSPTRKTPHTTGPQRPSETKDNITVCVWARLTSPGNPGQFYAQETDGHMAEKIEKVCKLPALKPKRWMIAELLTFHQKPSSLTRKKWIPCNIYLFAAQCFLSFLPKHLRWKCLHLQILLVWLLSTFQENNLWKRLK